MLRGQRVVGDVVYLPVDPWVGKAQLARHWGKSTRWIELRMRDGMPSRMMGGRRQYRVSACEDWLRENGILEG